MNTTTALMRTQLTICNERDVGNNQQLCDELNCVEPIAGVHYNDIKRFVAIVVHDTQELGNQSAMDTYGIGGTSRDGKIYVDNWRRVQIAIWNVIVNDIKFLVIGPRSFMEKDNHRYLVEKMIDDEKRSLMLHGSSMSQLFKTYAHESHTYAHEPHPVTVLPPDMKKRLDSLIQQSHESRTYAHEPHPVTVLPPDMKKRLDSLIQQSIDQDEADEERRILKIRQEETKHEKRREEEKQQREKRREEEKQHEEEHRSRMKNIEWLLSECERLEKMNHGPMHPGPVSIPEYVKKFWEEEDKHGPRELKWDELDESRTN